MIIQINSDFPNFKPINLNSGVNIILATKVNSSTNSVGKSISLELINFIMGADYSKSKLSKYKDLQGFNINAKISFDEDAKEYSRKMLKGENKIIFEHNKNEEFDLDDWKNYLLEHFFNIDYDSNILTWRNLFHFFYQNSTSNKFENALKSFTSEPAYKTSLFQSFLLNIAKEEIEAHSQTKQITSEKASFNRYLNTIKKSLTVIPELIPNLEDINKENNALFTKINLTKFEISKLERKINLLKSKNERLEVALNELKEKKVNDTFEDFSSFFKIIEAELSEYIKRSFKDAQIFHENLINENINVIHIEVQKNNSLLHEFQLELKSKYLILNKLLKDHEENYKKADNYNYEELIIKNLVQNGGQAITSVIDRNIKEIEKSNNIEIPKIIKQQTEKIKKIESFLTTFVNSVYKYNKNVKFNIHYKTELTVDFKYDDDSGTGKGNMKIIIYYIFILLLNKIYLGRNIDFLILDTDITDGIDSDNLFDLLKITDRLFKKHNLQLILTLRNDRNLNWDYIKSKKWIKHTLSDSDNNYLFKPNLK